MKSDPTMKLSQLPEIKETTVLENHWITLLRKYRTRNISIIEENKLRWYAEIYGIFLED